MNKIDVSPIINGKIIHSVVATDNDKFPKQIEVTVFSFEVYDTLVDCCQRNIEYFGREPNSVSGKRYLDAFRNIIKHIEIIRRFLTEFQGFVHEYDFDEITPANGYRSLAKVTHEYIKHTTKITKYIAENRGNFLFRKQKYVKEIETCNQALVSISAALKEAIKIRGKCAQGSLIPSGKHDASTLFNMSDLIDQKPFYGRCIALHYCESLKMFLKLIGMSLAGFSGLYYNKQTNFIMRAFSSIYNGSRYFWNAERRAERFLDLSLHSSVDFAKTFLSLTEKDFLHTPTNLFNAKIKVNRLMTIPPEPLEIENTQNPNEMVQIPIPSSHLGVGPVTVRLLSNVRRAGMKFRRNTHHIHPMSNSLVFHCHGGGFIAHTSKSHEIYLRRWAAELQVPIVSVDYSLSPQAPYPRALEEAFYAYCWSIKNAHLLGTTAERIVVVGDSAGALLNIALMLKCIEQSVHRPDGALLNYAPLILGFEPTPSRLLTGMDILLPFGFLMKCFKNYVHPDKEQYSEPINQRKSISNSPTCTTKNRMSLLTDQNPADEYRFNVPIDPFLSPLLASDEMLKRLPSIKFVCGEMDPLVDESVTMAKKLKKLGNSVGLDVLAGLPHGFLNMIHLSKDALRGNRLCISHLNELLGCKRAPKF